MYHRPDGKYDKFVEVIEFIVSGLRTGRHVEILITGDMNIDLNKTRVFQVEQYQASLKRLDLINLIESNIYVHPTHLEGT